MPHVSSTPTLIDETTGGAAASGRANRFAAVTANEVTALQSMRAYPSVSILASTRPGEAMHGEDIATLRALAAQAERRLIAESPSDARPLLDALNTLIGQAVGRPVDRAVALFVSATHSSRVDLAVPVTNRCIIDPTFATRDLVRALHHTPRHAVLLLSADEARLLHGHGYALLPAGGGAFPAHRRGERHHRGRTGEPPTKFLRRVDRALGVSLRLHPMPLVLVAAEPTASQFRRLSRNTARLAGVVRGNYLTAAADQLTSVTRPVLREYLRSRAGEALELIEQRAGRGRVLRDIDSAWRAARWERPEMLAIEEDYSYPARLRPDGDGLIPAQDVEHPEVIDDAVDELIEIVLSRGGWIALLAPGQLPDGTHLALTLHRP